MQPSILPTLLCAALLASVAHLPAQNPGPAAEKPRGSAQRGLDRDEARRLAAARAQAENDPVVRSLIAARESVDQQIQNAMNAAILAADPSLAPTLQNVQESRDRAQGVRERFRQLSPEQREQLKQARAAAGQDPSVVAARQRQQAAETPEERREAGQAVRQAMRDALVRQNPELAPLLQEMDAEQSPRSKRRGQ
jgi:hypothetical protein